MPTNPVIVVPGITANYLDDLYPLPPETIWSVLTKDYQRAGLHLDNTRFEATEPAMVRGGQLFEICYREMIEELRHDLTETEDEPVPVYPFAYDWRQPLELIAEELDQFIDEVIARTALMRHYAKPGYDAKSKVDLVGHSMGGLVILTHLQQKRRQAKIRKIVTLATPFRGSFESVIKITTGTANLGVSAPSSREREAARMTPSLYCLVPDLPDSVTTPGSIPNDLFDPAAWQPSVIDTIEEYVRLYGVTPRKPRPQALDLFEGFLKAAKDLRNKLKAFKLSDAGLTDKDWLCVVGVDSDTRVRLKIVRKGSAPEFEFNTIDR
jgi:pimeloyl-ACP methyl ester carboxylesterase